jgi:hypothetical protein
MRIFLILALLFPCSAHALSPGEFAGGFLLEAEPGFALQRIELPWEVYNASVRADLGDMRVFNAADEEVPMHLRRIVPQTGPAIGLPLFRLGQAEDGRDYDLRMRIRTSERGAVVETMVRPSGEDNRLLLLDATNASAVLGALRFDLGEDFGMLRVDVRGSDDLATWHDAGSGVLARMEHQNGRIRQDRIDLRGRGWKYYLVSAAQDLPVVEAAYGEPASGPSRRSFAPLSGRPVGPGTLEFELPPGLPVDLLDLDETDNAVLGVEVQVADGDEWRRVAAGSLFRLTVDGQRLSGAGLPLRGPLARMRVIMQNSQAPLRVGWLPHELVFMAQGEGPYTLALGNPSIERGADVLAPMLTHGGVGAALGEAALGAWKPLGGAERLRSARNWTRLVLWAVLGLGVALLGAMAWHLARNPEGRV